MAIGTLAIMHFLLISLVSVVLLAVHQVHATNLGCINGLCPVGFDCVNNFCVKKGGQACLDVAPDCVPKSYLCNNSLYFDLMTKQCPKTCGRCGGGGGPKPSCFDNAPASECAQKSYLCNNSLYFEVMNQQCRKTCGRC